MSDQIKIYNVLGHPLVWDADDWAKLRSEHHITGSLIGTPARFPRQVGFPGLPACLHPYEVAYLIEKKVSTVYRLKAPLDCPSDEVKAEFDKCMEEISSGFKESIIEEKKRHVLSMIDRIIEGKKRKRMSLGGRKSSEQGEAGETSAIDRETLLKEEIKKIEETPWISNIIQIPTVDPWFVDDDFEEDEWKYPTTPLESLRCLVFKDLMDQGYYVTDGVKFGGDFLVYPGEPCRFHAHMVVLCVEQDSTIPLSNLIHHIRLATMTKKVFVIGSSNKDGKVFFESLQWAGLTSSSSMT